MTSLKDIESAEKELDLVIREYQEDIKYHPKETLSKVWEKRIPKLKTALACMRFTKKIIEDNPYPQDIFIPLTNAQWRRLNKLIKKELGFPLDKLSGEIGRKLYDGLKHRYTEIRKELL